MCPECGTEVPRVGKKAYVRHYVKENGRGTPIAGSAVVAPKVPRRTYETGGKKVKSKAKGRRRRKWTS